jgi:DNA replication licensing factor MCM7
VPEELKQAIVAAFVDMRAKDKARAAATGSRSTLTARQLLSILRLAQAYARLEMSASVQQNHVDEAIRLISVSKASVMETDGGERPVDSDYVSRIWSLLRDKAIAERKSFGGWGVDDSSFCSICIFRFFLSCALSNS